jgi:coatomer protein complex subunit gamma
MLTSQDINNTLPETILTDVSIIVSPSDPNDPDSSPLEEEFIIPVASLPTNEPGTAYVAFKNTSGLAYPTCSFSNTLKFTSKEIDPSTGEPEEGGYEDEYQIEDLELGGTDYVVPAFAGSWEAVWDETGAGAGDEATVTLELGNAKNISGMVIWKAVSSSVLTNVQRLLHSSSACSSYSPSMAAMWRCRIRRIRSNCMVRLSRTERLRCR